MVSNPYEDQGPGGANIGDGFDRGGERVVGPTPTLNRPDRRLDLAPQPVLGALRCLIDVVPVHVTYDQHIDITGWSPWLPGVPCRP